jgi:MFS family permease
LRREAERDGGVAVGLRRDTVAMQTGVPGADRVAGAAIVGVAISAIEVAAFGVVSPAVVDDLGGGDAFTFIAVGYLAASIVGAAVVAWALFSSRTGADRAVAAGGGALAVGLAVSAITPAMAVVIVGRIVAGAGAGAVFAGAAPVVRGRPLRSVARGVYVAGLIAGPVVGTAMTNALGWRLALLIGVPVAAAVAAVAARTRLPAAVAEPAPSSRIAPLASLSSLAATALAGAAVFVLALFIPLAHWIAGESDALAGATVDVAGFVAGLAAVIAAGWVFGRRRSVGPDGGERRPSALAGLVGPVALLLGTAALLASNVSGGGLPSVVAAAIAGIGVGLRVAAPSGRVDRSDSGRALDVVLVQAGGLVGLAVAVLVFLDALRTRVVANLQLLIDVALLQLPPASRADVQAAAETALTSLAQSIDPSNIASLGQSVGATLLASVPPQYRDLVQSYTGAINAAFTTAGSDALRTTFLVATGFAAAAAVASIIAVLLRGADVTPTPRRGTT